MREKWDNFKRENQKPIKQYKKLLGWCFTWIITVIATAGVSAMFAEIAYQLVRG